MTWIEEQWNALTSFLRKMIEDALGWLVDRIEDLTVWISVTRHNFNIWLADFLSTDLGFLVGVGGFVLVVGAFALSIKYGLADKVALFITNIMIELKQYAGSFLEIVHYSEIYSLNEIAKILIPGYRDLWTAFYKAMGALAEEIGLGVGTITTFLRNSNNLILSTYTAIGYTMDEAEVIYMQESNEFFSKVDARFEQYARDPESIFQDINDEIVRPHLELQGSNNYKLAKGLDATSTFIVSLDENVFQIEEDLKTLISDLPEEIEEAITKRTDTFFETIDDFRTEYITPVVNDLNDVNNVVENYIETQERQRENWAYLLERPATFMMQIEALPSTLREEQRRLLTDMINSLGIASTNDLMEGLNTGIIKTDIDLLSLHELQPVVPEEITRQPVLVIPTEKITNLIGSWFVGEY